MLGFLIPKKSNIANSFHQSSAHPTPKVSSLHRDVHPCISWSLLLSIFAIVSMPVAILAAEGPAFVEGQPASGPSGAPPASMPDPSMCIRERCEKLKADCATKIAVDATASAQCEHAVNECVSACQHPQQQNSNLQPFVKGDQNFQLNPDGQPPQGMPKEEPRHAGSRDSGERAMPGSEDQKGQSPEMEAKMKEHQRQGLEKAKQGMSNFGKQLSRIKARIAALEKKGIKAPAELSEAIAKADEILAKVKAAESFDEIGDAGDSLHEVGDVLQEQLPKLERLANLPKIYARIDKQIKLFDRQLAADKLLAKKSKIDLTEVVADFDAALTKTKEAYAAAKAAIAAGDVDGGFSMLEQDVFESMDGVGEHHAVIQQVGRLVATISQANLQIKQYQRQLDNLKRAKHDTAAAQAILDEAKVKHAELKTAALIKPIDPDAMIGILQELEDIRDRFMDALNKITGTEEKSSLDEGLQVPSFQIPDLGGIMGETKNPST